MADQEVVKHVKAAIEAAQDKKKSLRHKLQEILLEVLIIVFAVSLSIWLHGWAEGRKDGREEREFLEGLKKDLELDLKELKSDRATYQLRQQHNGYFERVGNGEALNVDSANAYAWIFGSWSTIEPRSSRFEALKGSGRLSIIENKDLLYQITELFTKDFPRIKELNEDNMNLKMNHILPYLTAHVTMDAKGRFTNWEGIMREAQMRMLLKQQRGMAADVIRAYEDAIGLGERILGGIAEVK